ncbi:hypothetical protein D769_28937 [Cupriavidus sp. HMR-1]|uniref:hypothetical protein n=1 Tax=Cupriavidus sp. HMR-1 TaxID=1249621 RepID=UPI0002A305EC|nr:hypothetical protein [Cupriavidus sp. HMR-1]EKZ95679.1 hypothetical protein D769_28937 [Cupriavidus sp. HMR-1]
MKLTPIALCIAVLALSACGGGGDSSTGGTTTTTTPPGTTAPTKQVVSGVAATGAAMQGATVTLTDASGKSTSCPADATTGSFQCDVTGLTAPFVLAATGNVADSQATLISLSATAGTQTINITPLTNAIAATIIGDNPTKLLDDTSLLQSKVTASSISTTVKAYSDALAALLAATGNTGVDLISGPLTAGAPGLDRLLDQVKVNVLPNGGVQLTSVAGASSDTPTMLQLAPGVAPTAADTASLPSVATIGGQPVSSLPSASDLAGLQAAFNQCFAASTTASARLSGSVAACEQIIVDDVAPGALMAGVPSSYLSNGANAEQDLGSSIVGDDGMTGAVFSLPEIIRVQSTDKVWIKVSWTRADGIRDGMQQIAQIALQPSARTTSDNGWRLVGNQRHVLSKVTGNAQRWDWLNAPKATTGTNAFVSSLSLQVGITDDQNVPVDFAVVTGPGLRAGVLLKPSTGACDTLNIHAQLVPGDMQGVDASAIPGKYSSKLNSCRNSYRLAGVAQDPAAQAQFKWPGSNAAFSNPQLSATELANVTPFGVYTFAIYQKDNAAAPAYSYAVRLRTPPPSPDTLRQYAWQEVSKTARDALTPGSGSEFAGGATFPMSWTSASGVPFVKKTNVQIRSTIGGAPQVFVSGNARARPAAANTVVNVSVPGDQGAAFPAVAGATGTSDMSFANLSWSDTFDLSFSTSVEYDH